MGIKNFALKPVGEYLESRIYYIPDYQREYSWEVDNEIDDFWLDLESAVKEDRSQHFFGQVVIHCAKEEKEKRYIIDGQQRSSTSVIFLCVLNEIFDGLYRKYNHRGCKRKTEDIRIKYIGRCDDEVNELKLHLGKIDRGYFMKFVQNRECYEEDSPLKSHVRIRKAYEFFKDKFEEIINSFEKIDEKYNELCKYYTKFIDGFNVMYVETDDINEAFIIFETLNARGKDLETSDLLKNHLFRISGQSIDLIKSKWQSMIDVLDKIDTTKYIRHYWNSRDKFIREKDLYKKIREKIDTPKKCEELVDNLLDLSEVYKAMVKPNDETYFSDSELNQLLCNLKIINASAFYPIILSMKNMNFDEKDIREVAKLIENLIVRNCVVAGKVANKYEVLFAKIAYRIYEKEYVEVQKIKDVITENIIKNDEFRIAFSGFSCRSKPVIRYLLKSINKLIDRETEILNDNKKIHIEHIMPEKKNNWDIDDDIHGEFFQRFGNLTLLGSEYNKSISNKKFEEKKKVYSKSTILITRELKDYEYWDEIMIQKRQEELAKLALEVWKI